MGGALVATWENCILVSKMQYFHWLFKVLQNPVCVPAMKKSPKGDFLHNPLAFGTPATVPLFMSGDDDATTTTAPYTAAVGAKARWWW